MLGVLAVVVAFAGAVHADRTALPRTTAADHQVRDLRAVPGEHLVSEALPAAGRTPARHTSGYSRIPAGVVPVAAALAAVALAAVLAAVIRGRRLTETPTRLPPRAPPAAGTSVPGHGVGRRPVRAPLGAWVVAATG